MGGMTTQSEWTPDDPQVHPAGLYSETVRYELPFGGVLFARVEQDRRDALRYLGRVGERESGSLYTGTRDEVFDALRRHVTAVARREIRRREGSLDPRDHVQPPGGVGTADLWQHMHECYDRWVREYGGGFALPAEQVGMMRAERAAEAGEHDAAYRWFVYAWVAAEDTRQHLDAAEQLWRSR